MIGELVAFGFGLVLTSAVGVPLIARLAQAHVWRRSARPDARDKQVFTAKSMFEPVDFGPDLMRWPSEIERPDTNVPAPQWPSASWDDPHFGKAARALASQQGAQEAGRAADRAARQAAKPAPRTAPAKPRPAARQAPPQQAEKPAREAAREAPKPAREAPKAKPAAQKPAPRPQPPPEPARQAGGLPDRAAVEQMVSELGLAGTVQHLMRTQGWDFKEAAGWLARVRKG